MKVVNTWFATGVVEGILMTHEVEGAITPEHAISISSDSANKSGFGDAELRQSWVESRTPGIGTWFVQWSVDPGAALEFFKANPDTALLRF